MSVDTTPNGLKTEDNIVLRCHKCYGRLGIHHIAKIGNGSIYEVLVIPCGCKEVPSDTDK